MTRIPRGAAFVLALAIATLGVGAFASTSAGPAAAQARGFTPLPPGWELCILQGVSAPTTTANVVDLDEWQAAEGGSTNNTAAFNPYNTLRMTDVTGTRLPGASSANGFPAFPTWAAGCAATVATLLQPNMWVITAGLRAGNITPTAAFLAVVDQSAWCAPSPDGEPCYVNAMESSPGSLALAVPESSALAVYGNVNGDLQTYQQSVTTVTNDQNEVATRNVDLTAAESSVATADAHSSAATHALRGFAVSEYVSSGLYSGAPLVNIPGTQALTPSTPQSSDGVVAQQYVHLAASNLVSKSDVAAEALNDARQHSDEAAKALAQSALTLTSDESAENNALLQLMTDLATLENAGACTTVVITPPPADGVQAPGSTTTTTTVPPTSTSTTSTTTTVPPSTTTTTTSPPTITSSTTDPPGPSPPTTTTTTVPPTTTTSVPPTTTTTVPPTTTTTTTPSAAGSLSGTRPAAEATGISALQGCIATLAPSASA